MSYLFIFIAVTIASCSQKTQADRYNELLKDVIIDVLLQNDIEDNALETRYLVVEDSTSIFSTHQEKEIQKEVLRLKNQNLERSKLLEKLVSQRTPLPLDLTLAGVNVRNKISSDNRPVGFLKLSSPVISTDSYKGVFFYEFICGADCGSGNLVFVKWENKKWEIDDVINLYVY